MKNRDMKYYILYGIIIITFVVLISAAFKGFRGPSFFERLSHGTVRLDDDWYLEDGTEADIGHLNKNAGAGENKQFSVFHTLPEELDANVSLIFRSKNAPFKLYIDGELRYEPYVRENPVYTKSYGSGWHIIELSPEDSGKILELKTTTVYKKERSSYDSFKIDSGATLTLSILNERIAAIVTSLLLIFTGVVLVIADIPINRIQNKNHELLFLGMFALSIALWCLAETNVIQLFSSNFPAVQIISYLSLMLIPIPGMLYLNEVFKPKRKPLIYITIIGSSLEFFVCLVLNLLNILDYRETLKATHIMLGLTAITIVSGICQKLVEIAKTKTDTFYLVLRVIGLSSLGFGAVADLIRFYKSSSVDTALFTRSAILIFIACYGASSLQQTIEAVKAGARTKFISQLAYIDGLTGIGNRTAFQEHLSELDEKKHDTEEIGIIMCDVNDLKKVNDNLGHHFGDEMLLNSAKIINSAFGNRNSRCFRIGGDEFVVVMKGENIKELYESSLENFNSSIMSFNRQKEFPFSISIASGFSMYDREQNAELSLNDVLKEADLLMYENKKKMKAQASPT